MIRCEPGIMRNLASVRSVINQASMDASSEDTMAAAEKELGLRFYLSREPMIMALLSAIAIVLFLGVGGLSRVYHAQRDSLGNRWFARGVEDLKQQRYEQAAGEFRAALRYSRDNYAYQLNLAQALIGLKRTGEAYAYLINLWERKPENGLVNLELARIAAPKGETEQALRYYHNAIYAAWPGNQELERRNVRLELIEYLLGIKAQAQAQSELIALAANLDEDPSLHQRVGDLFLQAQDNERALAEYRLTLKSDHRNAAALAGRDWPPSSWGATLSLNVTSRKLSPRILTMRKASTGLKPWNWSYTWIHSDDKYRSSSATGLSCKLLKRQVSVSSPVPLQAIRESMPRRRLSPRRGRR